MKLSELKKRLDEQSKTLLKTLQEKSGLVKEEKTAKQKGIFALQLEEEALLEKESLRVNK